MWVLLAQPLGKSWRDLIAGPTDGEFIFAPHIDMRDDPDGFWFTY